jgi:hypothetical protein
LEVQSTRTLAGAIGVSPAGLRHFLKGGEPYERTARKLLAWYIQHGQGIPAIAIDAARAAVSALADSLPKEVRAEARRMILDATRRACSQHGRQPPPWTEDGT